MASENGSPGRKVTDRLPCRAEWLAATIVACLLLFSAIAHLGNPYRFLDAIYGYRLVPRPWAELLSAILPFLHLTIAMLLIAGIARRAAFRVGSGLFLLYTVAQTISLARGLEVGCGCFGPANSMMPIGPQSIASAVAGLIICLLGERLQRRQTTVTSQLMRGDLVS